MQEQIDQRAVILKLPAQVNKMLFKRLDLCALACLGLTCKQFYVMFERERRCWKVPLDTPTCYLNGNGQVEAVKLYELLHEWMGPR